MKKFKRVIYYINRTFGLFLFGGSFAQIILKNYQVATYILLIVSSLFVVGYFIEKWSE